MQVSQKITVKGENFKRLFGTFLLCGYDSAVVEVTKGNLVNDTTVDEIEFKGSGTEPLLFLPESSAILGGSLPDSLEALAYAWAVVNSACDELKKI